MNAMAKLQQEAMQNFFGLRGNAYPGRGIVIGLDEEGTSLVQVYWIMGRSPDSRNRVFEHDKQTGRVWTAVADPSKLKNPDTSLIIYNAMREGESLGKRFAVVSNGEQTDAVAKLAPSNLFSETLTKYIHEPDRPNFTPRITSISWWDYEVPKTKISMLRKSPFGGDKTCDRLWYEYSILGAGFGHCVTTYSGDGDPLPAFRGEPLLMLVLGNIEEIGFSYWEALNEANRVSLAVKFIPKSGTSETFVINKYTKVPEAA